MTLEDTAVRLPTPKPLAVADAALFLDLDGTLAPIAKRPEDVGPDAARNQMLSRLQDALGGRLAVVSGRSLADIDRILDGRVAAVAAVHGLVFRRPDGVVHAEQPHPALPEAAQRMETFALRDCGLIVEDKGLSIALHYRLAPEEGEAARAFAAELGRETGLTLQLGDMVAELRTPGPTKGDSINAFLGQAPFAGAKPIFVGDDATDEHGFEAVEALGGVGVLVGPQRPTDATHRLADVEATLAWLGAAV